MGDTRKIEAGILLMCNVEAISRDDCCLRIAISYCTFRERERERERESVRACVCVASVIEHTQRMRHIILSFVPCPAVPYTEWRTKNRPAVS